MTVSPDHPLCPTDCENAARGWFYIVLCTFCFHLEGHIFCLLSVTTTVYWFHPYEIMLFFSWWHTLLSLLYSQA